MTYKQRSNSRISSQAGTRLASVGLAQDAAMQQQAAEFPGVGITLGSYKHNPFKAAQARGKSKPISGRFQRLKRVKQAITLKRTVITLAIIVLGGGGWLGGKFLYNTHKVFGGNILGVLSTTKLKGEDTGRVNILLAGNSADDAGHSGGELTDSIMIMSVDTKDNSAFLLSVPRDLYVDIPNSGHAKINYAYVAGENDSFSQDGYPNGGMGQLEQIISTNFGIPIDYYALIDYNALKQAVDAVGGIDLTIKSQDPRGLYDPNIDYTNHQPLVKLSNGVHHLDGEQALDLARARGDAYNSYGFAASDFDRTQHQRDMLVALKSKAVSAGVLSNPAKLSSLSDAIGNNVKTDFKLSEVHRLYDLVKNINGSGIQSLSLNSANGKNLLASYRTSDGQSALTPAAGLDDFSDIQAYITQMTSTNPVTREGATIVVLNATSSYGLASQEETKLNQAGYNVVSVGNAPTSQANTQIIDTTNGQKSATIQALKKRFGNTTTVTTTNPYDGVYNADLIVVVGNDQVPATSSTTSTTSGQ